MSKYKQTNKQNPNKNKTGELSTTDLFLTLTHDTFIFILSYELYTIILLK